MFSFLRKIHLKKLHSHNFINLTANCKKSEAFSVAELSVVIVASGLLLFTAFKGFDLVKRAKVNSLVKQISEVKTAIDVFYDANGGLPGDITNTSIADFSNLSDSTKVIDVSTGFPANRGNNNGRISWGTDSSSCNSSSDLSTFVNESTAAWYQLFYGNYISDTGIVSNTRSSYSVSSDVSSVGTLPKTKIKGLNIIFYGNDITTSNPDGLSLVQSPSLSYVGNNLIIGGIKTFETGLDCSPKSSPFVSILTTSEATMLDKMIDDGIQTSGNVIYCATSIDNTTQKFSCLTNDTGFVTVAIKLNRRV